MEDRYMVQNCKILYRVLLYATIGAAYMVEPDMIKHFYNEDTARRYADERVDNGEYCMYDIEICAL